MDGAMVLTGRYAEPDGTESLLRGTWTPQEDGTVVQAFERSTDGGATWSTWFVGIYRRQP
ncbi:MAG: hypothetical protein D6689_08570 [Deltaproteobacteria bacterium]|nr:MAG: hypothetical protein D6689_08570 [Deltaproteobacteria bacterium]